MSEERKEGCQNLRLEYLSIVSEETPWSHHYLFLGKEVMSWPNLF
jgi:hypothetical protein